jgi:hypothetical protein
VFLLAIDEPLHPLSASQPLTSIVKNTGFSGGRLVSPPHNYLSNFTDMNPLSFLSGTLQPHTLTDFTGLSISMFLGYPLKTHKLTCIDGLKLGLFQKRILILHSSIREYTESDINKTLNCSQRIDKNDFT